MVKNLLIGMILLFAGFAMSGCASGKNIEVKQVKKIHKGRTTESQIRKMFGEPTSVDIDYKRGRNKALAGAGTAVAGMVLGPVGLVAGYLASNNVQSRVESKVLNIIISMRSHRVIDYNFRVTQGRTKGMGIGSSIGGL